MVLTETDYEQHREFRQTLFDRLALTLQAGTVVIVGQSLRDPHLRRMADSAIRIQNDAGAPGRTILLTYEPDPDRDDLMRSRGLTVIEGDIDRLVHGLVQRAQEQPDTTPAATDSSGERLPSELLTATTHVSQALTVPPDPVRLFNGSPGTFADVQSGFTFERDAEMSLRNEILDGDSLFVTVLGAGGVGKTTLAHRLLNSFHEAGVLCFEHRHQFPFQRFAWLKVERQLREAGKRAVLLVDDSPRFLNRVNKLAGDLVGLESSALKIVLTANSAEWNPRIKSPYLYSHGKEVTLKVLSMDEIRRLLAILNTQPPIAALVDSEFKLLDAGERERTLRRKCRSDMYLCLKSIFAFEELDELLLREFSQLPDAHQDVYRHVALLESTGGQAHRQLLMRMLGFESSAIISLLDGLDQVITEFDIDARNGFYGWSTRHREIAQTIARYKFSRMEDRENFLSLAIESANPTYPIESALLNDLCDREFGVLSLDLVESRERLLRRIIERVPASRVPRHRLISHFLKQGDYRNADREIERAKTDVGDDPPLRNFRVRAKILRARKAEGIMDEDRLAILNEALKLARAAVDRFPDDKQSYGSLLRVCEEIAELSNDGWELEQAYVESLEAYERLLDPVMSSDLRRAYGVLQSLQPG